MTNALMNAGVLLVLGAVVVPVLRRVRPAPLVWAALLLVALTIVFDTLMIAADLYVFDPDLILGVYLWGAPVEDLAYALAASMLLPALWTWLGRRDAARSARAGGEPAAAPGAAAGEDR